MTSLRCVNPPPRENSRHFADDIIRLIFLNEKIYILIQISLKFVPEDPIHHNPALVQVMAWHRIDVKPLSETMPALFTDV